MTIQLLKRNSSPLPPTHSLCGLISALFAARMSVLTRRAVAPLCLIILACTLVSGGKDVPIILNGLINQSVLMSLPGDLSRPVLLASWNFKTDQMATYTNNQLIVHADQFKERLETLNNGRTLRIGQLRLEDSGLYTGAITFTDTTSDRKLYNLAVYEPVPTPSLNIVTRNVNDSWCNTTLNCSVPNKNSSFSYTWKSTPTDLDFQLSNNNTTIQMSLKNSYLLELICIVQNPIDQKKASIKDICVNTNGRGRSAAKDEGNHGRYGLLAIILILIPLAFLGYYLIKKRKRRKAETPAVPENVIREPQYIQVTTLPPNDDKQVWNNTMYDSSPRQKPKAVTVYAVLEHPMQKR